MSSGCPFRFYPDPVPARAHDVADLHHDLPPPSVSLCRPRRGVAFGRDPAPLAAAAALVVDVVVVGGCCCCCCCCGCALAARRRIVPQSRSPERRCVVVPLDGIRVRRSVPDPHADPVSRLDPPETAHLLLQALLLSHARVGHLHGGGAEILDAASVGVFHGHEVLEVGLPSVVVRRRVGPSGGSPGGVGVGVRALGALPPARRAVAERIVPVVVAGSPAGRAGGSAGRERSHRAAPRGRRRERTGERAKRRRAQHRRRRAWL